MDFGRMLTNALFASLLCGVAIGVMLCGVCWGLYVLAHHLSIAWH